MKLFGNLRELVSLVFRTASDTEVTITPASQTATGTVALSIPDAEDNADTFVLEDAAATLTQKSIDADNNPISNLGTPEFAAAALTSDLNASALSTQLVTADEVKDYVDTQVASADEFLELTDVTPADYLGDANKIIKVNNGDGTNGTALEFGGVPGGTASGDIVDLDTAQTMSNKTIDNTTTINVKDSLFSVQDNLDATKKFAFQLAGQTTGKTVTIDTTGITDDRTYTLPDTSSELVNLNSLQQLDDKTLNRPILPESSIAIVAGDLPAGTGTGQVATGSGPLNTMSVAGTHLDGHLRYIRNNTGSALTIVNDSGANGFITGTGLDLRLAQDATLLMRWNSGASRWYVVGGAGGGGGLTVSSITANPSPAVQGFHYLTDSSGGAFSVTLPAGSDQAVIRLSDDGDNWGTNAVTLVPAAGESIDGQAADESYVLDVAGIWVQLTWNGSTWQTDDPIDPALVSGGGMETADSSSGDVTVAVGRTRTHPYLTIRAADTYTINGRLVAGQTLVVDGTLIVNGTSIVHNLEN